MKKCRNCKNKKLKKIIKIGTQPLSGVFFKKKVFNAKKYPLDLFQCQKCKLVQISKTVNSEKMFGETYEYRTSLSQLMVNHIKNKVNYLKDKKLIDNNSKILDIGSNDGTFLNFFKTSLKLVGIDPSAYKFKKNYNKNIEVIYNYFSKKNIEKNLKKKLILM